MRVGITCPYDWAVPGGVKQHVSDLAISLQELGHQVQVLTPCSDDETLPPWAVSAGSTLALPYNGSIARIKFDPFAFRRTRRWIRQNQFDVLHVHEPWTPSPSIIGCWAARGPIVATFHTSNDDSTIIKKGRWVVQSAMERVSARIAVSEEARRTLVSHIGGDAMLIPNGVRVDQFANAKPLAEFSGEAPTIAFVGRVDESRKGFAVLCKALPTIVEKIPNIRVLVAGPGDSHEITDALPEALQTNLVVFGELSDDQKASVFASADIYVAPNTGKESFGIILLEAMASGTPIVASDIVAFRDVLRDGEAGRLVTPDDPAALAEAVVSLMADKPERERLAQAGRARVAEFDWPVLAKRIVEVYESVRGSAEAGAITEEFRGHMYGPLTKAGRVDRKRARADVAEGTDHQTQRETN